MLSVIYAECHNAKFHYAGCRYPQCHGTNNMFDLQLVQAPFPALYALQVPKGGQGYTVGLTSTADLQPILKSFVPNVTVCQR